jgi:YggT family protein
MSLLIQLIDLYSLIVLVAVVASWMQLAPSNPIASFVNAMTEPLLDPIRRALPPMGGLDFSPMVLLIGLRMIRSLF